MQNPISKFNDWYDTRCKEPWRMLLMLVIVQPFLLFLSFGRTLFVSEWVRAAFVIYLFLFFAVLLQRIYRSEAKKRKP